MTAAQQAADAAATLAGSKGKVLVQTATPAVADRLAQNLWIDITGNANTPKRWNGSAWVTVSDKVATDAAAAAANALAVAQTKADASTVQALTNTVSQQGNTITAQGTELTNIKATVGSVAGENLLLDPTFSNSNGIGQAGTVLVRNDAAVPGGASSARVVRVSPATGTGNTYYAFLSALNVRPPENGNAAQIAVVGGEVYDFELYAYVAAARGQCGLWIQFYDAAGLSIGHNWVLAAGDGERVTTTTGGWVKLTGMATVPAAAIRMAMTLRVGAGNATDVFMSAPAARKRSGQDNAQASALQSVDARVSVTEGEVSSQGSAITQLNNTVAGKADNSALQSLQSTVSQQGNTLNSQGQAVTQLQSTVGGIGGAGTNLIPAEYSSFTETLPAIQKRNTTTVTAEAFSAAYGTHRLKVSDSTTDGNGYFCLYANNEMLNLRLKPSTKYIFSAWVQSGATARTVRLRHRYVNAAGSQVEAHLANLTLTTEWGRISASFTTPAALVDRAELLIFTTPAAGSQDSWWDGFMIEEQIGANVTPSSFAPGTSTYQAAGQATAISQLNTTVNQQGTAITAHATRLDGLYAQVSPEMEGDSSGLAGEVGSLVGVWTEQSARIEDGIATGRRVDTVQSQVGDVEGSVQAVSASVQQVTETIAGVDGRVSAMTTIKAETISGGRRVMAGLALGSDGQTSEILAFAQRFAIVDESSGNMTLPFVVQGGQVFISQAIINQAFIKEIVAGMSIRSSAVNSQGLPLLEINFASGTFTLRGQDANGSTLLNNGGLYVYDANGVERTAVGRMS
ncbi:Carbohydrate binding domain protein [compost metagenome]